MYVLTKLRKKLMNKILKDEGCIFYVLIHFYLI
jgi:hypothetical protein